MERRATALDGSQVERLELLLSVARDLTSILDLDRLLNDVGHLLQTVIPYEHFSIFLYDKEREELIWRIGIGYSDESRRWLQRFPVTKGLVGRAVRTLSPVISADASLEPDFLPATTDRGEVPRSALAIPLIYQGEPVGAMTLESTRRGDFNEEQEQVLSAVGSILAIALVNARLYEESQRDAATKELLYEVSHDMSSILDLQALLDRIADLIQRVIEHELFAIFLMDPLSGDLILKNTRGWSVETIRRYSRVKKGQGLFWKAIRDRRPFIVDDATGEASYLPKETFDGQQLHSQINVPLLAKDKPVGVMSLEAITSCCFTAEHQKVLGTLANQIAVAIENARLYEELLSREKKLGNDLQLARQVQLSMLPDEPPNVPGFEIGSTYLPAESLGGDFYDFLPLDSDRKGILIADVSGKGVGAAMIMAASRGAIRAAVQHHDTPSGVLHAANRRLFRDIKRNVYVTACYGVLDPTRGAFTYSSAGHFPPVMVREDGEVTYLGAGGTVMGMFDGTGFEEETVELRSGDVICLYTDGIVDAFNRKEEIYGEARLEKLLQTTRRLPAAEIARLLIDSVHEFASGRDQHDDMTVIVLKSV
jgi:sigma-B regulation protein RsbU (phosphoserine phosphatase)